jgi:phosphatidylglycerophosphate synthase
MITAAVIVAHGESEVSPLAPLGGLSLLKRAVLTVQKAGVTTCYIVTAQVEDAFCTELSKDKRVTAQVVWLPAGSPIEVREEVHGEHWCVVFAAETIFRPSFFLALAGHATPGNGVVVTDTHSVPAVMLVPVAQQSLVIAHFAQGRSFSDLVTLLDETRRATLTQPGGFCFRVSTHSAVAAAERALLRSLENPRDGFVDTYFNRRFSRPLSRWLLRTPLSPNQVTLLACLLGLLGALCFFPGGYWGPLCGALLLQFSAILDCCDGEIARVKFMESPFGGWLDIVCDTIVHLAIFLGIGVAVWQDDASQHALLLAGMLALGGVLAFPLVTLAEKTEEIGAQRNGWEDERIKKLLAALATRDFSVLIVTSAVFGKLGWFLWGAAIGAQLFWLVLAWLLFRAGRFTWLRSAWEKTGI